MTLAKARTPASGLFTGTQRRMTAQRRQVVEVLRTARRYLTAKDMHDRLRGKRPRIGLATVYRTLEALREIGVVSARMQPHGETAYVWCARQHHHHAVCMRCGRVEDVRCRALPDYKRSLSRGLGFAVLDHQLEFFGVCARCS
jgi:Fur family ferric uptake transcriptional regulator